MKAACNNNLPTQTNDVIVNPENPDSKLAAAPVISCGERANNLWFGSNGYS
jgi:hypothetical protein